MRRKCKRPIIWVLFIFAVLTLVGQKVSASENFSVAIPVQQSITAQTLSYQLTATTTDTPIPADLENGTFDLAGKTSRSLDFNFERPGKYNYQLTVLGANANRIQPKDRVHTIEILAYYDDPWAMHYVVVIKDATGYKVDAIKARTTATAVPVTTTPATKAKAKAKVPITGRLPQTSDLVRSFSWLGLLLIAIALLKLVIDRRKRDRI